MLSRTILVALVALLGLSTGAALATNDHLASLISMERQSASLIPALPATSQLADPSYGGMSASERDAAYGGGSSGGGTVGSGSHGSDPTNNDDGTVKGSGGSTGGGTTGGGTNGGGNTGGTRDDRGGSYNSGYGTGGNNTGGGTGQNGTQPRDTSDADYKDSQQAKEDAETRAVQKRQEYVRQLTQYSAAQSLAQKRYENTEIAIQRTIDALGGVERPSLVQIKNTQTYKQKISEYIRVTSPIRAAIEKTYVAPTPQRDLRVALSEQQKVIPSTGRGTVGVGAKGYEDPTAPGRAKVVPAGGIPNTMPPTREGIRKELEDMGAFGLPGNKDSTPEVPEEGIGGRKEMVEEAYQEAKAEYDAEQAAVNQTVQTLLRDPEIKETDPVQLSVSPVDAKSLNAQKSAEEARLQKELSGLLPDVAVGPPKSVVSKALSDTVLGMSIMVSTAVGVVDTGFTTFSNAAQEVFGLKEPVSVPSIQTSKIVERYPGMEAPEVERATPPAPVYAGRGTVNPTAAAQEFSNSIAKAEATKKAQAAQRVSDLAQYGQAQADMRVDAEMDRRDLAAMEREARTEASAKGLGGYASYKNNLGDISSQQNNGLVDYENLAAANEEIKRRYSEASLTDIVAGDTYTGARSGAPVVPARTFVDAPNPDMPFVTNASLPTQPLASTEDLKGNLEADPALKREMGIEKREFARDDVKPPTNQEVADTEEDTGKISDTTTVPQVAQQITHAVSGVVSGVVSGMKSLLARVPAAPELPRSDEVVVAKNSDTDPRHKTTSVGGGYGITAFEGDSTKAASSQTDAQATANEASRVAEVSRRQAESDARIAAENKAAAEQRAQTSAQGLGGYDKYSQNLGVLSEQPVKDADSGLSVETAPDKGDLETGRSLAQKTVDFVKNGWNSLTGTTEPVAPPQQVVHKPTVPVEGEVYIAGVKVVVKAEKNIETGELSTPITGAGAENAPAISVPDGTYGALTSKGTEVDVTMEGGRVVGMSGYERPAPQQPSTVDPKSANAESAAQKAKAERAVVQKQVPQVNPGSGADIYSDDARARSASTEHVQAPTVNPGSGADLYGDVQRARGPVTAKDAYENYNDLRNRAETLDKAAKDAQAESAAAAAKLVAEQSSWLNIFKNTDDLEAEANRLKDIAAELSAQRAAARGVALEALDTYYRMNPAAKPEEKNVTVATKQEPEPVVDVSRTDVIKPTLKPEPRTIRILDSKGIVTGLVVFDPLRNTTVVHSGTPLVEHAPPGRVTTILPPSFETGIPALELTYQDKKLVKVEPIFRETEDSPEREQEDQDSDVEPPPPSEPEVSKDDDDVVPYVPPTIVPESPIDTKKSWLQTLFTGRKTLDTSPTNEYSRGNYDSDSNRPWWVSRVQATSTAEYNRGWIDAFRSRFGL